jgi:small subunit ribosomal protein S13
MRILGITLPEKKRINIALTYLYGIGHSRADEILTKAKVNPLKKSEEVTADEENAIRKIIEAYKIEGDLKR